MPKFTVTIQNYNDAQYVVQSIESVLAQSYTDYEFLCVDDGSTDNSVAVMRATLPAGYDLMVNRVNAGVVDMANWLISQAKGDYLFMRASDDWIIDKDYLLKAARAFDKYPEAAGCYSACEIHTKSGVHPMGERNGGVVYYDARYWRDRSKTDSMYVPAASVILRTDLMRQFGGFSEELGPVSDSLLTKLCAVTGGLIEIRDVCVGMRRRQGSYSDVGKERGLELKAEMKRRIQQFVLDEVSREGV